MPFLRYANARVTHPHVRDWDRVRVASGSVRADRNLVEQASKILKAEFDPKKYLLTHATIVASVDTVEVPRAKLGATTENGKKIVRKTTAFRIKPECDQFINNNLDSWARPVLLKSYKTFVGAHSFVEHVQIENLSKGRIIDAVARDVGDSVYVDILVANDRKHEDLCRQIESGELATLSMGCFLPGTQVTMGDGRRVAIEDVQVGDQVLTHKGRPREVLNKQIRGGKWGVRRIEAVGVPSAITATDIHPFFVYRIPEACACGCGEPLPASYSSGKKTSLPKRLRRRFKDGHHLRILNPNGSYSMGEYASRKARLEEILVPRMEEVKAADLKVGDFLVFPRATFGEVAGTTVSEARLLGYFLAEGNFLKANGDRREVEFSFSLHEKDTYAAEVCNLLRESFPGCEPRVYLSDENDGCAATVRVSGPGIADWFYKYGGEYSHGKRLHPEVLRWDIESQLHLLGAWVNGDGHLQKAGVTSVATVSYDLACQMHAIMARCGISPRMYGGVRGRMVDVAQVVNGGLEPVLCDDGSYRRPVFQLDLGQTQAQVLRGYSDKVKPDPKFSRQECRVLEDAIMFPITSIEAQTYEGWVHDMEVEEDHSYVVEGVAVHNCSIDGSTCTKCGHWAADETEFCFPPGTRVLKSDGKYVPIEEIVAGDLVLTHTGAHRRVLHTMSRSHSGHVSVLKVDGVPTEIRATTNHPFWVLRPATHCACGCGAALRRTVEHERGAAAAFKRRFLPGHNSRVWNSNLGSENVLSFEDYSTTFDVNFEFVPAKDVNKGDYLAFPIPQEVRNTKDATKSRARLIGYFLAEGSFVKRDGERVGVEFSFGSHEADTLAAEVRTLLDKEWGRSERRVSPLKWEALSAQKGVQPIRRRRNSRPVPADLVCPSCDAPSEYAYNVRFKAGRDDCYQCKVCDRQWIEGADRAVQARLYPSVGENGGSCSVVLSSKAAADWFFRYCGEYAEGKQIHPDVLLWSPEIQKHVLLCWLNGDGSQSHTGVWGGTASFHLMSQMHVVAARCGWYGRKQVVFGNRTKDVRQVVNGRGETVVRDERGWLPQFRLNVSDPTGFSSEVRWVEPEKARVTLSAFTDGYKRVGNWMLYRVRETGVECYSGPVHNFEVEGDNSYVVEGVAVHNCDHVRYEKGNVFYDENGKKYRVAELCGDESLDPTGGVTFVEASWVKVPAFTGAVARNVLSIDTKSESGKKAGERIRKILESPAPRATGSLQKAARFGISEPEPKLGGAFDEDAPEEAPEAPAPATPEESPLSGIEKELKKFVLENVKEQLQAELTKSKVENEVLPPSDAPNDTIVKQAALAKLAGMRLAYRASLRAIVATSSSDVEFMNGVASLNREIGISVPVSLYRVALKIGARDSYRDLSCFLKAAGKALGHEPSKKEARTLIRLASVLGEFRNVRRRSAD